MSTATTPTIMTTAIHLIQEDPRTTDIMCRCIIMINRRALSTVIRELKNISTHSTAYDGTNIFKGDVPVMIHTIFNCTTLSFVDENLLLPHKKRFAIAADGYYYQDKGRVWEKLTMNDATSTDELKLHINNKSGTSFTGDALENIVDSIRNRPLFQVNVLRKYERLFYADDGNNIGLFNFKHGTFKSIYRVDRIFTISPVCPAIIKPITNDCTFMSGFMSKFIQYPAVVVKLRKFAYNLIVTGNTYNIVDYECADEMFSFNFSYIIHNLMRRYFNCIRYSGYDMLTSVIERDTNEISYVKIKRDERTRNFYYDRDAHMSIYGTRANVIRCCKDQRISYINVFANPTEYDNRYDVLAASEYIADKGYSVNELSGLMYDDKFMCSLLYWCIRR